MEEPREIRRTKTQIFYEDGSVGPTEEAAEYMNSAGENKMENEEVVSLRRDSEEHGKRIQEMKEGTDKLEEEINRMADIVDNLADEFHQKRENGDGTKRTDNDVDSLSTGSASKEGVLKCYVDTTKHDKEEIHRRIDLLKEGLDYARGGGGGSE